MHPISAFTQDVRFVLGAAIFLWVTIGVLSVYLIPTIIALTKKNPREVQIAALNVFLGWTVLGWIAALVLALRKAQNGLEPNVAYSITHSFTTEDRSFRALIQSDVIDRALIVGSDDYRKRWLKLAHKAGVLDKDISDRQAQMALLKTRSSNGFAGFFAILWLPYRRARGWWLATAVIFTIINYTSIFPEKIAEIIDETIFLLQFILFGFFSDGWLLITLTREQSLNRKNTVGTDRRYLLCSFFAQS